MANIKVPKVAKKQIPLDKRAIFNFYKHYRIVLKLRICQNKQAKLVKNISYITLKSKLNISLTVLRFYCMCPNE